MQAEHIPVHLGAMPAAVAAVLGEDHAPGDAWILNDPFRGGTHLPDITVVTPGLRAPAELLGFAASRAHHADVGGRDARARCPPTPRRLDEEGVVIAPTRARRRGAIDELWSRQMRAARASAWPTCAPSSPPTAPAQAAARARRARWAPTRLRDGMAETWTTPSAARAPASPRCPTASARPPTCSRAADGRPRAAAARHRRGRRLMLDFTGSRRASTTGNLNCPLAVTAVGLPTSPLRVLTDPDIPPCAGAYRPLTVIAPEGSLLNARAARRRRRGQRRDLLARRRPRARRVRPRARARAR